MTGRKRPGGNGAEYRERKYRNLLVERELVSFQVQVKETDLYVRATRDLREHVYRSILRHRYQLEQYILGHPEFVHSLVPVDEDEFAPPLVRRMLRAARFAGVGPMASVAGAVAEAVGQDLLEESSEVMVENGGDIFLRSSGEVKVGIFPGLRRSAFEWACASPRPNTRGGSALPRGRSGRP